MPLVEFVCAQCRELTSEQASPQGGVCGRCGEGAWLEGRYALLRVLGRGAFGTTWLAERREDGRKVAVKELLVRDLDGFKAYDLFHREAEVLRGLEHPGIPRYYDHFQAGQGTRLGLYLVTEFIEGRTLADELREVRHGPREVLAVLRELLGIVGWLHGRTPPVIHRDIKPGNVMRRASDGALVLIDFGAVREAAREADGCGSTVAGTFGYMAPEQLAGRATAASDIYAIGVLGLELATRQGPQAFIDDLNRLRWEGAVEDAALRGVLARIIVPDARARASDALALAALIESVLGGGEVPGSGALGVEGASTVPSPAEQRLFVRAIGTFMAAHGVDLRRDAAALARVRTACALAVRNLDGPGVTETALNLPFIGTDRAGVPLHLLLPVTHATLREEEALLPAVSDASEADGPGAAVALPPAPPRALPADFERRVAPRWRVQRAWGVSLLLGALALAVGGAVLGLRAWGPMAMVLSAAGGVAAVAAVAVLGLGWAQVRSRARLWREGVASLAVVERVAQRRGLPDVWELAYRFEGADGVQRTHTCLMAGVPEALRVPGSRLWALHDAAQSSSSVPCWEGDDGGCREAGERA